MLIGTINICHFILLSLALPGGYAVKAKQNILAYFLICFSADQDEIDLMLKQSKLNIPILLFSEI